MSNAAQIQHLVKELLNEIPEILKYVNIWQLSFIHNRLVFTCFRLLFLGLLLFCFPIQLNKKVKRHPMISKY